MTDLLALVTIIIWPVIPLFWIPVHGFPGLFKKLGLFTYIMPFVLWFPLAYIIYARRMILLQVKIGIPLLLHVAGLLLLIAGTALQIWTGRLLSIPGLMGLPEITKRVRSRLVTDGAYSVVRHPTYLSHTLMLAGVFFISGVAAVCAVTLLDLIIINGAVIPLEERELLSRFGSEYSEYKKRVPRFFPRIPRQ